MVGGSMDDESFEESSVYDQELYSDKGKVFMFEAFSATVKDEKEDIEDLVKVTRLMKKQSLNNEGILDLGQEDDNEMVRSSLKNTYLTSSTKSEKTIKIS